MITIPGEMAGNFNYPAYLNQFTHGMGGQGRHHDAGAGVAAAQYYGNPIFSQLNWMMQSQAVVHCKCMKNHTKEYLNLSIVL